jgi:microcystin-dependent protein
MPTKISNLVEDAAPATNSLCAVVVNNITRKTALQNILNLVTGGTVTSVTGGTNLTVSSVGTSTQKLTISFNLPGMVVPYAASATTTPPAGWLFCNGQSLSTTTYAALYAVIGYTYGGSGANFNVPDLRGRSTRGVGTGSLGSSGGSENVTLTSSQVGLPSHNHTASGSITIYGSNNESAGSSEGRTSWLNYDRFGVLGLTANGWVGPNGDGSRRYTDTATTGSQSANASQAHNNMPPSIVLTYLIKT